MANTNITNGINKINGFAFQSGKNNILEKNELTETRWNELKEYDTNKDESLSFDEYLKYLDQMALFEKQDIKIVKLYEEIANGLYNLKYENTDTQIAAIKTIQDPRTLPYLKELMRMSMKHDLGKGYAPIGTKLAHNLFQDALTEKITELEKNNNNTLK